MRGNGPFGLRIFGACGVFFWRFLRLAIVAGVVYGFLFSISPSMRMLTEGADGISRRAQRVFWRIALRPFGASVQPISYSITRGFG